MTVGALAAFVSAVAYAISVVSVRVLLEDGLEHERGVLVDADHDAREHAAATWRDWPPIQRRASTGVIVGDRRAGCARQVHLLTLAFRSAPASMIAPFEYTALLWGVVIDWLAWDTLPSAARLHRRRYRGAERVVPDLA